MIFSADNKYYFELDRFTFNLTGVREETIVRFNNQSSLIWRVSPSCIKSFNNGCKQDMCTFFQKIFQLELVRKHAYGP